MLSSSMISPQFNSTDPYKVLGVPMNATEWQIKSLYHTLAKLHHPDCLPNHLNKDDGNRIFAAIGNAYEILGNTENRRVHAASLRIGVASDNDGLGLILTESVFYGTVTFKIMVVLPLKMKAKPNCTPPFLLTLNNSLCMQIIQPPLVFMGGC